MKAYYAHCKVIYRTPQEQRDIATLVALGFDVINPASEEVEAALVGMSSSEEIMAYFERFADECDLIAFRALPGGTIPAGVAKEINWFQERKKPVIELPGFVRPILDVAETRQYLSEIGER